MIERAFENGEVVPVSEPLIDFEYPADELPEHLAEIVNERVRAEEQSIRCETVVRIITEILDSENKDLAAIALAVAGGLTQLLDGRSMASIASERGITRAALSKRVVELSERLGLSPSRAMRTIQARKNARTAQLKQHHAKRKNRKDTAGNGFAERFSRAHQSARG